MIVSASRRTDIPAFYADWFMQRIRAGSCTVPNPFKPRQVSHVSLAPGDVDAIVFWTRNPEPLLPRLQELDSRGYRYYFQYTLMDNLRLLDSGAPAVAAGIQSFLHLAGQVGPERALWRYDPIVLSTLTPPEFHVRRFERLASALRGATRRCTISLVDVYRKAAARMGGLKARGLNLRPPSGPDFEAMIRSMVAIAGANGMEIVSCAEEVDLIPFGVRPGKCIDDRLIARVFGIRVTHAKDPSQRPACGCVASRDIGMYDTCPAGCVYCYATNSLEAVARNRACHNPSADSLVSVN